MRRIVAFSMLVGMTALIMGGCGGGGGGGGGAADTVAPTVTITAPNSNATVSGTVTITASASDNVGVTKVEFYVNSVLKSTVTTSSYSYVWDTTTLTNGTYTLAAKAYDAAGNVGQSSSISVTVLNAVGKTATLKFSSQSSNNPSDQIGGFDLTVTLPIGASIKTDVSGVPLSTSVFLSGQFQGLTFGQLSVVTYDISTRTLTIKYPTSNSYPVGEFITIICDVPTTYTPTFSDIVYSYIAYAPLTGAPISTVTATGTFN